MSLSYGFCLGEENSQADSGQFSYVFSSVTGDGVGPGDLEVTAAGAMSVEVAPGFALAAGRWLKSDEAETFVSPPADNHFDRYDAVVAGVDLPAKTVGLYLVQGEAGAIPRKYQPVRTAERYEIILCHIMVRMGATQITPEDLQDTRSDPALCGVLTPLDQVANSALQVYGFLDSGIDREVDKLEEQSQALIDKGSQTVEEIEKAMAQAAISKPVGEVEVLHDPPTPAADWLLCGGQPVPAGYPQITGLVGEAMPDLPQPDRRFQAWMYAGAPL